MLKSKENSLWLLLLCTVAAWSAEAPFSRGVNLTNWLQAPNAQNVHFAKFGRADFAQIQQLGCDVVRLPINLHAMTSGPPDYRIDPLLYDFLDQIADWADELGLHLILDNHTFDPAVNTSPDIGDVLVPVWTQLAAHFAAHPAQLYYEILNEPHGISDAAWNAIQQQVIDAIRQVDQQHAIVVGPSNWNSFRNLQRMPVFADDNLVYTFHFYEPFVFTHQGASWTNPSLVPLRGVPFPYERARMPALPSSLQGTWVGTALGNYSQEGTIAQVHILLDEASAFQKDRGVPLFCGEFGVYSPNSDNSDRVLWYEVVRQHMEERGITWTTWDYRGGFGLFERGSDELFDFDLNVPLLEALGLNVPPQRDFVAEPDQQDFVLYEDFLGPDMVESNHLSEGTVDYYDEADPAVGRYCMRWTGVPLYGFIGFDFKPFKDLSSLAATGYAVEFWVRGDTPGSSFDIRLVDTDTEDPDDHPWRVRHTIDEQVAAWDGGWHKVRVPLGDFAEHGAWENEWFNPIGAFDWQAIDRFDIVAEHHALDGIQFWFDELRIVGPVLTAVLHEAASQPAALALAANYPNPFNATTAIRYALPDAGPVHIDVYNMAGQRVRTLVDGVNAAGWHTAQWDGTDEQGRAAASGIYVYRMIAAGTIQAGKMTLIR